MDPVMPRNSLPEHQFLAPGCERWRVGEPPQLSPGTVMLSLLRFSVSSDLQLLETNSPANKLWQEIMFGMTAVPGCLQFYWGKINEITKGDEFEVLIPFKSASDWHLFQRSVGMSLAVDLFNNVPIYRFMEVSNSIHKIADCRSVEIRDYRISPRDYDDNRRAFDNCWQNVKSALEQSGYQCEGGWLDIDSPLDTISTDVKIPSNTHFVLFITPPLSEQPQTGNTGTAGKAVRLTKVQTTLCSKLHQLADIATGGIDVRTLNLRRKTYEGHRYEHAKSPPSSGPFAHLYYGPYKPSDPNEYDPSRIRKVKQWQIDYRPPPPKEGGHWAMGDIVWQHRRNLRDGVYEMEHTQAVQDVVEIEFPIDLSQGLRLSSNYSNNLKPNQGELESLDDSPTYTDDTINDWKSYRGWRPRTEHSPATVNAIRSWKEWLDQMRRLKGLDSLHWGVSELRRSKVGCILTWVNANSRNLNRKALDESLFSLKDEIGLKSIRIKSLSSATTINFTSVEITTFKVRSKEADKNTFESMFVRFGVLRECPLQKAETSIDAGLGVKKVGSWVIEKRVIDSEESIAENHTERVMITEARRPFHISWTMFGRYCRAPYYLSGWIARGIKAICLPHIAIQYIRMEYDAKERSLEDPMSRHALDQHGRDHMHSLGLF